MRATLRPLMPLAGSVLLLTLLPATALAQQSDLEYREPELDDDEDDGPLSVSGGFESAWYEYDNMDLRPVDESSDQAILDSDDRNGFAFSGASLALSYDIDSDTVFTFSASHRGLWGNDQLGTTSEFGSLVYMSALYVEWAPGDDEGFRPVFTVGRQFYSLGALGGAKDYVLADTLDMARVDLHFGDSFHLELLPVNIVGLSGENDRANFFSYIGQSDTQTFGFRGDHMTRRHGLVAVLTPVEALDARAYGFYTDIGALGSGSDISYDGKLGNFSDNDWVANVGVRGTYEIAEVASPYVAVDYSMGVDRKELVADDVDCNGLALQAGITVDTTDDDSGTGFEGELGFFQALGPGFEDDGMMFSHGYVGMKGRQTGGLVVDRFMGWHPTAYVGMFGVSDSPHDIDRKTGTRVISADAAYTLPVGFTMGAGFWFFQDTGTTFLDMADLDTLDPPFGYSSREFAAQDRLGRTLGMEIDVDLAWQATDALGFFASGGAFLPGEFYSITVDEVAGDQLGGQATAWAGAGGMEVSF